MKKLKISSLLLGTFLMPVVGYGSAGFGPTDSRKAETQFVNLSFNDTALFWALENGDIDKVRKLLDHGANVNVHAKEVERGPRLSYVHHVTPLIFAIKSGNVEMVRLLLDLGANVNDFIEEAEYNYGGSFTHYLSSLVVAIRSENIDIVRLLLERGASVNTEGGNINVPLYEAVKKGCENMVRLLLEQKGINVNVPQNVEISYDDYERIGYGGGDYSYQVPKTSLALAEETSWKMGKTSVYARIAELLKQFH
jgi:ankyrin repeat protein